MPTFEVDVQGKTYEVDAPDSNTAWAWAYTTHQQQFGAQTVAPKPVEKTSTLRAAADIPVQVGRGVAIGVKALTDVFGADNPVSRAASGVEDFLGGLLSAQAKNDQAEIARIMKEAQDKGVGDQVSAAVKAFATAPVDMLSQALGTAVPVIAGGLAGSIARLGAAGVTAVGTGVGAAMGAGTVKGQIYDAVKQELKANNVPEAEAEKRAQEAQAYGGKNLDQILMGAGIGAAEAAFGAERILTGLLRKGAVAPSALPAKYRIPTAAATEAVPEMAQAAQEQVAQNIALQREGYDVPTMRGVVGQAALEGIAGLGLGAITGAAQRTEAAPKKPTAEKPAEPQQAEVAAPEAVKGESGIVRPEEEVAPLTPEQSRELELQQRLYRTQAPTAEGLLGEIQGQIQTAPPTTPQDIARIRDEHETSVINSLLEQDKKMQAVSDMARANMERMSQLESMQAATQDADRRVREGRLMARVQSLIDENIPFASTAIADINRKFDLIGEAPLSEQERSRVQNIMTMTQGFTDFVKLPSLPVREQDRFAENQAMESLIKERKPRGQVSPQPIRAEAPAPSPVVGETPVSGRVEEGRAIRPEVSPEPSIAEDRQRAAVAEPAPVEAKRGAQTRIIAGKEKIPAQWEVVEADSVKAAMTEGKTQPRDRQRAASNAQIMSIAEDPDFDRLSDTSQTMDYGAPTLTEDYSIVGGNGRFEGVNLSYDTEAGQRYKQALIENAERLGLNPEQIGGMKKPVLVRRITQAADTRKLAIQSNITAGLELSDMEQAALDAERMKGLEALDISESGDIPITSRNMDILRSAFGDFTTEEMGKMMSAEGGLSQAGLRRVKNAILYKAYGKTDTLARLIESPDADLKNIGNALMRASGPMSQMMDGIRSGAIPAEYNIIEDLTGAIETLSSLRASGTKVEEFLAQSDMFGDGISGDARSILRFMDNNLKSAKAITKYLNDYAQVVLSTESATGGLFGEMKLPTKQETLERAAQRYEAERAATKAQRTLEEQPTGEVRPEARVQPEGEGRAAVSDEKAGVEPTASPGEDYITELFGTPEQQAKRAEEYKAEQAVEQATKSQNIERIKDAIRAEQSRAKSEYDDWASRKYKKNKAQVELEGEGPSSRGSMSISEINESRRRRAMEALAQEMRATEKLLDSLSTDFKAGQFLASMEALMNQARDAVKSGNWPGYTVDKMFESMFLEQLKFRGPSGRGSVVSNKLSKAVLNALKGAEAGVEPAAPTQAEINRQRQQAKKEAAEAKRVEQDRLKEEKRLEQERKKLEREAREKEKRLAQLAKEDAARKKAAEDEKKKQAEQDRLKAEKETEAKRKAVEKKAAQEKAKRKAEEAEAKRIAEEEARALTERGEIFGESDKHPEWARNHENASGKIVYSTKDSALFRGFSVLTGQYVYAPVETDGRYRLDVDSKLLDAKIPAERLAKLRAAKARLVEEETAKLNKYPDGPFTNAKGNVVASDGVDSRYTNYLTDLMQNLGLGGVRVFLVHPDDVRSSEALDKYRLYADWASVQSAGLDSGENGSLRVYGTDRKSFYITVQSNMSETRTLETIAHELGHLIQRTAYDTAPADVRAEIRAEYEQWLVQTKGKTARELIKALRNRETAEAHTETVSEGVMASELTSYWTSFSEWFADNVSRWATTSERPVSIVEKFFKSVADKLRSLVALITGHEYAPAKTVAAFLDKMGAANPVVWAGTTETRAEKSKSPEQPYRGEVGKETPPTPTTAGQQALDTINQLGMGVKAPEPTTYEKTKAKLNEFKENPSLTIQEAKKNFSEWLSKVDSMVFSADAKFENDVRKGLKEDMKDMEGFIGTMLSVSQSGAVHADAVATQAVLTGRARFDTETQKWVAEKDDKANMTVLAGQLDKIAEKYGLTKEEAVRVAHTYFVAKNYNGILARNEKLKAEAEALKAEGKDEEAKEKKDAMVFVSDNQKAMVQPGLDLVKQVPELTQMVETWNDIRQNFVQTLVDSYLWSPEYATAMLDNIDYVPFYREKYVEEEEGPQMMIRGLQVKAKEHKLKGSDSPVNDVFDNMARWMQYAMNRAIRNHKALQMIDVATEMKLGDKPMAEPVTEAKRGMNVVKVWRGGKQELYNMADPYYLPAFQSLGAVSIPTIKFFTEFSNMLRRFVVMYPLFSVAQVPQDAVAAIFASGLKPKFAFKIPYLAVKEFIKTYRGMSDVHNELKDFGAVGVRDFNAAVARQDAEITAGIKLPRGGADKLKFVLERIAMSADNAVRQAVYQASMDQGLSKKIALEKAFDIINFRRRGSSKMLNLIGQTVPFFYAYLSAQRVAYKTVTGIGISPGERKAALETLAYTSAAVMALSFIYAMANGDDEAYEKTPGNIRDRSILIPGTNGFRIPLRPDFFLFPKIIAEHTYNLMADNGTTDPAKFKKAMADNLANAALSPNVVPQVLKPTVELAINYDFFSGKPIVGFFEKNKEASRQFNESTSEFAKLMGQGGLSPQMVDHFVRGYFGSVGGLFLWGTNFFIEGESGVPRPELTWDDAAATMPGVGAFRQKPTENALKVDFYELRDSIEKAKNTYDDIKKRSPEGLQDFIADEKNYAKLALEKAVTKQADHLSKIRRAIQQIAAAPEDRFSALEKQERIKELREVELQLLKSMNLPKLREMAKM